MNSLGPWCFDCTHYIGTDEPNRRELCIAFSDGIPKEIWSEGVPHIYPRLGDHGFQFDPKPGFVPLYEIPEWDTKNNRPRKPRPKKKPAPPKKKRSKNDRDLI